MEWTFARKRLHGSVRFRGAVPVTAGRRRDQITNIPQQQCETVLLRKGLETGFVAAGWICAPRRLGDSGRRRRGAGRMPGCRGAAAMPGWQRLGPPRWRASRSVTPPCASSRQPKICRGRLNQFRVSALCPCRLLPETIGPTYPTWPDSWLTPASPTSWGHSRSLETSSGLRRSVLLSGSLGVSSVRGFRIRCTRTPSPQSSPQGEEAVLSANS